MKIIPVAVNKIEIEFEDGVKIEVHEVDTGHRIVLPKDMRLKHISEWIYRMVRREK